MDLQGYFDDLPEYMEFDIIGEAYYVEEEMDYFNGTGITGGWRADVHGITIMGFDFMCKDMPKEMQDAMRRIEEYIEDKLDNEN